MTPRTIQEVRDDPRVASLHREPNGWWCYLVAGLITDEMGCGTIHEDTVRDVIEVLGGARPTLPHEEGHRPDRIEANDALCPPPPQGKP